MIREKRSLLALLITLVTTLTYGQKSPDIRTIAEERIRVTASSATVLQWFDKIEKETQITLAYNPSHIDPRHACSRSDSRRPHHQGQTILPGECTTQASLDNLTQARHEPINQFSLFYDNLIRITPRITTQVGVHFVGYIPQSSRSYYSIQPRFSLKYQPAEQELIYLHFSRMEQFYHYLRFDYLAFPTDFRMPSIDGFKPRSSEHYEAGWKHFLKNGQIEISAYYKTRRNVVAFSPQNASEGSSELLLRTLVSQLPALCFGELQVLKQVADL